nr:Chain C, Gamma-aminobutyric acid receptor subunit alpha-3 [Rattus norvegicus]4TK1_D Chain D, Gamma-aminobutyric acid receptor subunit alpha-3 [Rattus norvegicus]4TK2_C Chain C, Gamma-aminobutyric acid receptor subunit alpha-3 [Rattus norvegicus]4TK2_D Chain D, Gamma-aminobutyric acid receptor subunit alpha-3 [Rattus norvegicus]
FNIVGTTYPIN